MVTNALGGTVRMIDLNGMTPTNSGWEADGGAWASMPPARLSGWGVYAGHTNAFLLTPVSAPVMMLSALRRKLSGREPRSR